MKALAVFVEKYTEMYREYPVRTMVQYTTLWYAK